MFVLSKLCASGTYLLFYWNPIVRLLKYICFRFSDPPPMCLHVLAAVAKVKDY